MADKIFVNGMIVKQPGRYDDFKLSLRVSELKQWLDDHADNDWVNVIGKTSQSGKRYAELDTWKPNTQQPDNRPQPPPPQPPPYVPPREMTTNRAYNAPPPNPVEDVEEVDDIPF